jgi:hypothetical protein
MGSVVYAYAYGGVMRGTRRAGVLTDGRLPAVSLGGLHPFLERAPSAAVIAGGSRARSTRSSSLHDDEVGAR